MNEDGRVWLQLAEPVGLKLTVSLQSAASYLGKV